MSQTLINQIATALAPFDAQVLKSEIDSISFRNEKMKQYKTENEAKKRNAFEYYPGLFDAVGGKGWYALLAGNSRSMIEAKLTKKHESMLAARNAKIAKKFEKLEITEVVESNENYGSGRFFGVYAVETNQGRKVVEIESILVGGYNIQCLHNRVLTKVR